MNRQFQDFVVLVLFLFACIVNFPKTALGYQDYTCSYKDTKTSLIFHSFAECAAYTRESIEPNQFYTNRCRVKECPVPTEISCSAAGSTAISAPEMNSKANCVRYIAQAKRISALATTSDRLLKLIEEKEAAGEARTLAEQTLRIENLRLQNRFHVSKFEELRNRLNTLQSTYLPSYLQYMKDMAQKQNALLSSLDHNSPNALSEALDELLDMKNDRSVTNAMFMREVDETKKRAASFCGDVSFDPFLNQLGLNTDIARAKLNNFCDTAVRQLEKRSNELAAIGMELQSTYELLYKQILAKRSLKQMQIAHEELKQKISSAAHLSAVNRFIKAVEGSYTALQAAEPQQGIPPFGYSEFIRRTVYFLSFDRLCDNESIRPSYMEAGCKRFNEKRETVSSRTSRMARLMTLSLEVIAPKIPSKFDPLIERARHAIHNGNISAAATLVDFLLEESKLSGGAQ